MPITAPTLELPATLLAEITIAVQALLMDYGPRNNLLRVPEFAPSDYAAAAVQVLREFNHAPPQHIRATSFEEVPEYVQVVGTAKWLLFAAMTNKLRNAVQISSDDDEVIGLDSQGPAYQGLFGQLSQMADKAVTDYKIQLNLNSAYGGMGSGYAYTLRSRN